MNRRGRLCEELTLDQVQDFTSGKQVNDVETIPKSKLDGYPLNPRTGEADIPVYRAVVPAYRRLARDDIRQVRYAEEAKRREDVYSDRNNEDHMNDSISTISALEKLTDTVSMITDNTLTNTIQLPEGMNEEQAVEVYKRHNFRHEYDKNLTITKYRQDIVDMVNSHQVTIIQGETGSGKTTQVPQFILDHYARHSQFCNIIVTQPRRIAASSIARRVCSERNWELGGICGYQVGMDKKAGSDTRLLYCTTGVLLQKLIAMKNMHKFTHVILDEVHERDQDSDFCILVVKKLLRSNSKDVKVILMSATFDSDMFARYFSRPIGCHLEKAPVMSIEGHCYEVTEYYIEDLRELGHIPEMSFGKPTIQPETLLLTTALIENLDQLEGCEPGKLSADRGSVLIFLPGMEEIGAMDSHLERIRTSHRLCIRPLHSTITSEEQVKVFDRPPVGHRKIILSTNIAESSITVSDIKYVIDFCLTKQLVCDADTNYTCLETEWASKANCIQRKGRAGRVSNGRVYRMVPFRFWREHLADYGTPEMQRCPLEQLVLKVKLLDLGEPKAILGLALAPPNLDEIEKTVMLLKEVGALASTSSIVVNPHDGELTFLGRVLGSLPLDIRLGKLIMYGHVFGALDEMIVISACLSLRTFFAHPFRANIEAYKHKFAWANDSFSDCIAYYNAYITWRNQGFRSGSHATNDELQWSRRNYIQIKRIREVDDLIHELMKRMKDFNIFNPCPNRYNLNMSNSEHQLIVKLVISGAFYPNYFLQIKSDEQSVLREMCGHNPLTTVVVRGIPANKGAFYRKELEDLFMQCNGRRPKVHFEGSRAFIEFIRDQTEQMQPNAVLSAVYVAVKLRELKKDNCFLLQLKSADVGKISDRVSDMSLGARGDVLKNRSQLCDDFHPPTFEFPLPNETIVEVTSTEIVNCGHFWVNLVRSGTTRAKLHSLIQRCALGTMKRDSYEISNYVLAPYSDLHSQEYYRARIEKIDHGIATVFFIDYGNYSPVMIQDLRPIDPSLLCWPVQAVECVLAYIKPSGIKCPGGNWSPESQQCFSRFLSESEATFAQIFSIVHGVMHVTLNVRYRGTELNINEELIRLNYADRAEESYSSMQSHYERDRELRNGGFNGNVCSSDTSQVHDLRTACRLREQEELLLASASIPRGTIYLHGPHNPCEIGFYSTTHMSHMRTTRVDRDSVNSVAFDTENSLPRLLVASFVSLNPSKHSVTVRQTTLMPDIPGLYGLLALLFCPTAELRTDREKRRYTGALCGLGWERDSPNSDPAFPEHDMEIQFDTEFDVDDLKMINGVRIAINLALGSDQAIPDWGPNAVRKLQKSAREKLLSLVRRPRKLVKPLPFWASHRWKQVEAQDILHPNIVHMSSGATLLSLHCGIALSVDSDDESGDTSVENKVIHQRFLESKASRSTEPEEIFCELCKTILHCPKELFFHLQSLDHRQNLPVS